MADIVRRIKGQLARVKAMRDAPWNARTWPTGQIQRAELKKLTRRHARLERHLVRARLWRGACATAIVWFRQRVEQYLRDTDPSRGIFGNTISPTAVPGAGHTDSEEEVRDPTASSSRQRVAQSPDDDITPNGTPQASPAISPAISDMDPEDAPWADSPDESSEPPGGFVTTDTNSWSQKPDGRPGSSGDDSRYSRTPRSPVPYDRAEQLGFDGSDYPQGFSTEDGDLGDVDG
jgi:hypothetical protein